MRLIWDCRKVNCRFRSPLWVPLSSPAALGLIELDETVTRGRRLATFQGDVPDWFYILELPDEMAERFVLEGVDPQRLRSYAAEKGIVIADPGPGAVGVGAKINPMGFSWAAFIAHGCQLLLGSVRRDGGRLCAGDVCYGKQAQSFLEVALIRGCSTSTTTPAACS